MEIIEDRFQYCASIILEHEGGLTNDKHDPGGITQWGISLRYLKSIGYDINGDGVIDKEDVIGLPIKGAKEIYRRYWWNEYRYGKFNELSTVAKVFDLSVNCGGRQAHKLLQRAINEMIADEIKVDGILGKITFAAANSCEPTTLRNLLRQEAKDFYLLLIENNPDFSVFKNGWLRRAAW